MQSRLFFCFFWISFFPFSQEAEFRSDSLFPEKIFLQLSSHVWATDQTLWFNAVVVNGRDHRPTEGSGLLYVDLIDPNGNIVAHKLVRLSQGTGYGSFDSYDDQTVGRHLIRAYTQWNGNFGEGFMFKTYVERVSSNPEIGKSLIDSLLVTEKPSGKVVLSGTLEKRGFDEVLDAKIPLFLHWKDGQDSLLLKHKNKKASRFQYEIPSKINWVTLSNGVRSETVVLNPNALDLQFFPESGKLVHGFKNQIAFKAVGIDGKGKIVEGTIFDNDNNHIADFKSNSLGMGSFTLYADSLKSYHARVDFPADPSGADVFPLPEVVRTGHILSVSRSTEKVWVRVASNTLKDNIAIKVSCRGTDYFLIEGPLQNGFLTKDLRSDQLPMGILVFTLLNENGQPLAERLFFNENDSARLELALTTDKASYGRRKATNLKVQVKNLLSKKEKVKVFAMAIHQDHWPKDEVNTLQSYFLMDSELKGNVENPGYYFNAQNENRLKDIDALLLTQGWRDYKYPIVRSSSQYYTAQKGLEMSGWVKYPDKKKKDGRLISLATFGKNPALYQTAIDSLGRFRFLLNNNYGAPIKALLSIAESSEKSKIDIFLERHQTPKVVYQRKPVVKKPDKVLKAIIYAQKERVRIDGIFDSLYGVTQLDEVVVSENRLTPEKAKFYKLYGDADVIISGEEIREKEKDWSYGLYSILLFNYGDQIEIERFPDGFMLAHVRAGSREATLIMVDGKLIPKEQYEFVPSMSPDVVESIELIKYAKFFKRRYLTVFPDADLFEIPDLGHIISIHTKGKVGVHGAKRATPGTLTTFIEQLSPIKEFYAPKYDTSDTADRNKPDLRSLVHWTPFFDLDASRTATLQFYNGDVLGAYVIIVEAISENGLMGYAEKSYEVRDEASQGLKR